MDGSTSKHELPQFTFSGVYVYKSRAQGDITPYVLSALQCSSFAEQLLSYRIYPKGLVVDRCQARRDTNVKEQRLARYLQKWVRTPTVPSTTAVVPAFQIIRLSVFPPINRNSFLHQIFHLPFSLTHSTSPHHSSSPSIIQSQSLHPLSIMFKL